MTRARRRAIREPRAARRTARRFRQEKRNQHSRGRRTASARFCLRGGPVGRFVVSPVIVPNGSLDFALIVNRKPPFLTGAMIVAVLVILGGLYRKEKPAPAPAPSGAPIMAASHESDGEEGAVATGRAHVADARERTRAIRDKGDTIRGDRTATERERWLEDFRKAASGGPSAMTRQIEASRERLNPVERASLLRESAQWLAGADAEKARALLEGVTDFSDRRLLAAAMIETLARTNSALAVDWVSELNLPDLSAYAHENLAKALAREDVNATIEWISGIEDSRDQVAAGEGLMFSWAQSDLDGALIWAGQLEPSEFRNGVYLKTSKMVAINDPAAAAQWASGFPGDDVRRQAMTFALHRWVERDPRAAADWAARSQGGSAGSSELSTVLTLWGERDPQAAKAWADGQAGR